MTIYALSPSVILHHADCREAIRTIPDNSIDSCVTDPPYALTAASRNGSVRVNDPETPFGRTKLGDRGFMGKQWDTGEVAFDPEFWREIWRILKPGAHVAAFGGTRSQHRLVCAIEDAGFEIRDQLYWHYGSGFPKSQNVAKFIDKELGATGETIATGAAVKRMLPGADQNKDGWIKDDGREFIPHEYALGSLQAQEFDGFGTALKPATEPISLARKPLSEATVAANVLRWRTGALNIDGCRVPAAQGDAPVSWTTPRGGIWHTDAAAKAELVTTGEGRWPANVVHDGSDEVVGMFPGNAGAAAPVHKRNGDKFRNSYGTFKGNIDEAGSTFRGDSGSAARFFYSAKASKADRNGSKHPTVKPISFMAWLARLITPPGGTILDPFAGSGTTGAAATQEGFSCLLCERESEYVADIRRRFGPARLSLDAFRNELALLPQVHALQARLAARA